MRLQALLFSGVFAGHYVASASGFDAGHALHHRRHGDVHQQMRRNADAAVHEFHKRATPTFSTADVFGRPGGVWPTVVVPSGYTLAGGVQLTPISTIATATSTATISTSTTSSIAVGARASLIAEAVASTNTTSWQDEASNSCMNAVMNLKGISSNSAGLAACYNVAFLDQASGIFEAEVRMYNISLPTGDFVGVEAAKMMVTLQYGNATITTTNGRAVTKRALVKRDGVAMPILIATREYVGQIKSGVAGASTNLSSYEAILTPQISISATNPSSKDVNTSISSTEASFNAGVISKLTTTLTNPGYILGKPSLQLAAAAEGLPTPFDLPGLSLQVLPVGLIVTSSWLAIFVTVVGLGTLGRQQYRHQYRLAVRVQREETQRRI